MTTCLVHLVEYPSQEDIGQNIFKIVETTYTIVGLLFSDAAEIKYTRTFSRLKFPRLPDASNSCL